MSKLAVFAKLSLKLNKTIKFNEITQEVRVVNLFGKPILQNEDLATVIPKMSDGQFDTFSKSFTNLDQALLIKDARRLFTSKIETSSASQFRFSQSYVTNSGGKYDNILVGIAQNNKWPDSLPPIDVVKMQDGVFTSLDNRRLLAAKVKGVDVKAVVHNFNEPMPDDFKFFISETGIKTPRFKFKDGTVANTYGEAMLARISKQEKSFSTNNAFGSFTNPIIK